MARPYRSRVRASASAVGSLLAAGTASALALAFLWPRLGSIGELAFIGVAARGLAIGALLALVIQWTRLSRPGIAAGIAACATAAAVLGGHYVQHRSERSAGLQSAEELRDQRLGYGSDPNEVQRDFEASVAELDFTGHWRAYFGIGRPAVDGASALWGAGPGIFVFSLEMLVGLLASMYLPAGKASEPACQVCGRWSQETALGKAAFGKTPRVIAALRDDELEKALAFLSPPDTSEFLHLSLALCPEEHTGESAVLRLREHFHERRNRHQLMRHRADLCLSALEEREIRAHMESLT